jgi:hypothetical protein
MGVKIDKSCVPEVEEFALQQCRVPYLEDDVFEGNSGRRRE